MAQPVQVYIHGGERKVQVGGTTDTLVLGEGAGGRYNRYNRCTAGAGRRCRWEVQQIQLTDALGLGEGAGGKQDLHTQYLLRLVNNYPKPN